MADISKIKTVDGTSYDIKDATARQSISDKVSGVNSSINNHIAVFDGTSGKQIKDSGITVGRCLPTVTSSDNGKVLRVSEGAWVAVSLPSASGVSF